MKTIKLSVLKTAAIVLLLTITFSACKKEPIGPPKKPCDFKASFEKMEGYDGYYGNYIIKLDKGVILYPCVVEDKNFTKNDIYEGMPVTVSYEVLNNEEVACQIPYQVNNAYILPRYPFYKAKITCISNQVETDPHVGFCGTE